MRHIVHRELEPRKPCSIRRSCSNQASAYPIKQTSISSISNSLLKTISKILIFWGIKAIALHFCFDYIKRIARDPIKVSCQTSWKSYCPRWNIFATLTGGSEISAGIFIGCKVYTYQFFKYDFLIFFIIYIVFLEFMLLNTFIIYILHQNLMNLVFFDYIKVIIF